MKGAGSSQPPFIAYAEQPSRTSSFRKPDPARATDARLGFAFALQAEALLHVRVHDRGIAVAVDGHEQIAAAVGVDVYKRQV